MALHILPQRQTFGSSFGAGLGQGLSSGMQALSQSQMNKQKLQQQRDISMQEEGRIANQLSQLGFQPQEALAIAGMRPQDRAQFVQSFLEAGGGAQSPQQELGGMQALQQLGSTQEAAQPALQALQRPQQQQEMAQQQSPLQQLQPQAQPQLPAQQEMQPEMAESLAPKKPKSLSEALQVKKEAALQKESAKQQQVADKETKKYYDQVKDGSKFADDSIKRLDRMEKLIEKGKLPPAALYNSIKKIEELSTGTAVGIGTAVGTLAGGGLGALFGGPAGALGGGLAGAARGPIIGAAIGGLVGPVASLLKAGESRIFPDTEEFEKLSNDFTRNIKAIYGARISNFELEQFMKMIPTLGQTDNGKKAIIRNLKNFSMLAHAENGIMKDIIKKNGGRRPINLQELVEEQLAPFKDELADDFREGFIEGKYNDKNYEPLKLHQEKK